MTLVEPGLTISEAAEATGLTPHTLRYYEREGLMFDAVDRASSSHRRYSDADIQWVIFLTRLRSTAMPIARVREYVELARRGDETFAARLALLEEHRTAVLAQLDQMTASLSAIEHKIDKYRKGTL